MPGLGDVYIPFFPISPNHFIKIFIPGMEDLFRAGDQILKVENSRVRSRLISWRTFDDENFGIQWQMDFAYEQTFILLPSNVVILDPVIEGRQSSFLSWGKYNLEEPYKSDEWLHITLIYVMNHKVQLGITILRS